MSLLIVNNASTTIVTPINGDDDPAVFQVTSGADFPLLDPNLGVDFVFVMIDGEILYLYGNEEITPGVWEFSAYRAYEGTVSVPHLVDTPISAVITADSLATLPGYMSPTANALARVRFSNFGSDDVNGNPFTIPDDTWTDIAGPNHFSAGVAFTTAAIIDADGHVYPEAESGANRDFFAMGAKAKFPVGASTVGIRLVQIDSELGPGDVLISERVYAASADIPQEVFMDWRLGYGQATYYSTLGGSPSYTFKFEVYQKSGGPMNLEPLNTVPGFPGPYKRIIWAGHYIPGGGL